MNQSENDSLNNRRSFTEGKGLAILLGALTALDPLTIDRYLPAFGAIRRNFHTSISHVELSVSTFFIGMAIGQLFYGPLADRFGRRKPLLGGLILYFIASLGCVYAPGIRLFIVFRLLQALGGCAGMVIARTVVRDLFDKRRVALFLSNMAFVMGIAPIIAPSIGSMVIAVWSWRAIFILLAGSNFLCMIFIAIYLPETGKAPQKELRVPSIIRTYASLLKSRSFVGYLIPDSAIRAGMFAYIAGSPFVFMNLFRMSASRYGLVFGINGLGLALATQCNRRLLKVFEPEDILRWSVKVAAVAAALVFFWTWAGLPHFVILASIFVFLATLNFVSPNSLASALESQGHQAGTASALYGCLQWGSATVSSLLVSYFHNGTAFPMTGVILFCGLISLMAYQLLAPREPSWAGT